MSHRTLDALSRYIPQPTIGLTEAVTPRASIRSALLSKTYLSMRGLSRKVTIGTEVKVERASASS